MVTVGGEGFVKPATLSRPHRRAGFTGLNTASERRRGDLVRDADVEAGPHVVSGFREIVGSGEQLIEVGFPVAFTQIPMFLNGASLAPGSSLVDGNFPVVSAVVAYWEVDEPDLELYGAPLRQYFRGARIALVTTGPEDQRLIFSWQFTGIAVSNPHSGQTRVPLSFETGRSVG